VSVVVGSKNDVEERAASREGARLHEGSRNEGGPFCLLGLHVLGDVGPVETERLCGIGGIKNPKGAANEVRRLCQSRMAWGSFDRSLGNHFMNDFWSGADETMVLSGRTQ
jgi:hypothetical protein